MGKDIHYFSIVIFKICTSYNMWEWVEPPPNWYRSECVYYRHSSGCGYKKIAKYDNTMKERWTDSAQATTHSILPAAFFTFPHQNAHYCTKKFVERKCIVFDTDKHVSVWDRMCSSVRIDAVMVKYNYSPKSILHSLSTTTEFARVVKCSAYQVCKKHVIFHP